MASRECSIDGCRKKHLSRGWCSMHYTRWRNHGDPLVILKGKNEGPCTVEGCSNPMRKRTWCAAHYSQWTREGVVRPFRYKWHTAATCVVCGSETGGTTGLRKFCSWNCAQAHKNYGGEVPLTFSCVRCGKVEDRRPRDGGRWTRGDRAACSGCSRPHNPITTGELVERDGNACGICDLPVDLALAHPDPLGASVDHVIPLAAGGENTPENCAVAHLACNVKKGARVGWKARAGA